MRSNFSRFRENKEIPSSQISIVHPIAKSPCCYRVGRLWYESPNCRTMKRGHRDSLQDWWGRTNNATVSGVAVEGDNSPECVVAPGGFSPILDGCPLPGGGGGGATGFRESTLLTYSPPWS